LVENKQFQLQHVKTEENTSDNINSNKNTKIDIHKKMADRLYNGLIMAEGSAIDVNKSNKKSNRKSSKKDVEHSNAIVINEMLPRESDLERASTETLASYLASLAIPVMTQEESLASPVKNQVNVPRTTDRPVET
jgi:hypothetical protein